MLAGSDVSAGCRDTPARRTRLLGQGRRSFVSRVAKGSGVDGRGYGSWEEGRRRAGCHARWAHRPGAQAGKKGSRGRRRRCLGRPPHAAPAPAASARPTNRLYHGPTGQTSERDDRRAAHAMADQQQQQQFQQPQQQQAPRYQPQQQQQQQHLAGGHLQQQQQKLDTGPAPPQTASQVYASIPRAATSSGPAGGLGGPSAVGSSQQVGHLGPSAGQPMQHSAFQQPQQQQQPSQPVYHQYRIPPQTQLQSQHPQQQPLQQHQHVLHIDPILQGPSLAPPHQSHPTGGPSEHDGSSSVNISSSANGVGTSSASGGAGASSSSTGGGGKKKRAPPTRWFAADDAAMVRVLLTEKRLGHETEHGFLASSWERVVEAVQETTLQGQKKDVQPCKDRYKLVRPPTWMLLSRLWSTG